MFCYQCQETLNNQGCVREGVCGKSGEVALLQDLLVYLVKGISHWAVAARRLGIHDDKVDDFVTQALFITVTNVNFTAQCIEDKIREAMVIRERIRSLYVSAFNKNNGKGAIVEVLPAAVWQPSGDRSELLQKAMEVGIQATPDADIRSLRELVVFGLKGVAAYADHARVLGYRDPEVFAFMQEGLAATLDERLKVETLLDFVVRTGKAAVDVMALLDRANRETYGSPEITEVFTGTKAGPAILVSGHDLKDLAELLEQTEGTGVNVYTHGEMLPANAYPAFKKYRHLIGNFGTSWYNQQKEFDEWNGAILFTTNCIQKPKASYQERVFSTGLVGWPGLVHIPDRPEGGSKDFSAVIAKAKSLSGLKDKDGPKIPIGFSHPTVLALADQIVNAVKSGAIKRFVVMSGCDGRQKEREYFTELARQLPADTVILTSGCAKFRYNMLGLGAIGGIPRVLDAGQCNDSYSWAIVAMKLKTVFGAESLVDLPISFVVGWYEQKAVAVLLALLYLGFRGIRLGPTLPAFISHNVLKVLVEKFDLKPVATVDEDLPKIMAGK